MNNLSLICVGIPVGIYIIGAVLMFLRVLFSKGPNGCKEFIILPLTWPVYFFIKTW